MTANQLFKAGQLTEAVRALSAEVRDNPTDAKRRTFLFELLCFAGDYDRAEKHLSLLADASEQAKLGAVLYHSALHAERLRRQKFESGDIGGMSPPAPVGGTINGQPFESIVDADPRIGARLEVFAAGAYLWIPFEHIVSIEMQRPTQLRDLLWSAALVRTGPAFRDKELGEVMVPVLYPLSHKHADESVRLGRSTVWETVEGLEEPVPYGQKMFLIDGEEFPLLEVRKLEFRRQQETAPA